MSKTTSQQTAELDKRDSAIHDYIAAHGKAKTQPLAELLGISIPSVRYRLFRLMAKGIVGMVKGENHQVWWFLRLNEPAESQRGKKKEK
jgi:Mn-dependent DtxR family transcriptional regulator